jgi:hypothetical protein
MKSQKDIERMKNYVERLYLDNFTEVRGKHGTTTQYASPITVNEDGEPEVIEGDEAVAIMGSLHAALRALEWVLEESGAYKYVKNEEELKDNQGKVMYDGDGKKLIPDTSPETFIAGIDGHW